MDTSWGFPNPATPPGSSSYYSVRFSPARLRDALAALLGWRYQLQTLLHQVRDPGVATAKLGWWREELQRTFDGSPSHPLGVRLAPLIQRHQLPPKPFLDMAWSIEAALTSHWPKDFDELSVYLSQDLGALFELLVRIHRPPGESLESALLGRTRRVGAYASGIYQIRDCGLLLRQGRFGFIPGDQLQALGLTPPDLARPTGRHQLPRMLRELTEQTRALRTPDDLVGLPAVVRIRVHLLEQLLHELEHSGFDLTEQRIGLTPIRKLWNAWKESRG